MSESGVDPAQAQDHLEMVDRILAGADRNARLMPEPFIAFGTAGGIADFIAQLIFKNGASTGLLWISLAAWLIAIAVTIYSTTRLRRKKQRFSVLDAQLYALFNVIWIVTLAVSFGGQNVFQTWAGAAIWSLAYGIALIFVGTQGNRVSFVGGTILIVSIIAANFFYPYVGYIFAAGMWLGMAGTGVALYATQRGRE